MKLSVICSDERLDMLPRLRSVLDNLFIESLAWYPKPDVEVPAAMDLLERCLDYSPYVLCLPSRNDVDSAWLHYAMGYQRGRTDRLTFWISAEDAAAVPQWLDRFVIIVGNEKDVFEYFAEVEETWHEETREKMARKMIAERNLEVSARAFVEAIQEGDRFVIGLFLEAGFSPSLRDAAGVPVLNLAIRSGHDDIVPSLLEAGADLNGVAEDRGTTPLMEASAAGNAVLANRLLQQGADLEHTSRDGQTAVILAVGNGRDDCAITLIRNGANVDATDLLGMSARKYATLYNQTDIMKVIEESEAPSR